MRNVAILIIDLLVALIAIGCVIYGLTIAGEGPFFFCMYTRLSNILAAIACALSVPYDVRALRGARSLAGARPLAGTRPGSAMVPAPTPRWPRWLRMLRLAGLATVAVTFLTVFLFLGFLVGHLALLHDTNFFFHLVSPLLMLVACVLGRSSAGIPARTLALPTALTAAYAVWYLVEVVVIGQAAGGWRDFYGFNTGGMWPVSMAVMIALSALVSYACWRITGDKNKEGFAHGRAPEDRN